MKKTKLSLSKTTIRTLVADRARLAAGAMNQQPSSATIRTTCVPGYTDACSQACWTYTLGVSCA
jgi:hypothetical protein